MKFKIESNFNDINKSEWFEFVQKHDRGNIFQLAYMFEIYNNTENYEPFVYCLYEEMKIIGLMVGATISYRGINSSFTLRNVITGGPLVQDNNQDLIKILLDDYNSSISRKILFTEIRNMHSQLVENEAYQATSFKFTSHLNFLIDLTKTRDELWSSVNRSKRKGVKKAEKAGITFVEIDIDDRISLMKCYAVIQDVYNRAKLPLPNFEHFLKASKNSNENNKLKIFAVKYNSDIIGARFALIFKDYIYGWYAGSFSKFYKYSPNEFLAWKTLEWGQENGFRIFDYGGAGKPNKPYGVRDFKSKFGGELMNFGRYKNVHNPIKMALSEVGFSLYRKIKT